MKVEGPSVPPISKIRWDYLKRSAMAFFCTLLAFAIFFVGTQYTTIPEGYFMIPVILLVFGSMAWLAFSNLDMNGPRCSYNLVMDLSRPVRGALWFILFFDPYVCPNCKLNLSEPYPERAQDKT
jgi:hypothetical protein